MDRFANSVGVEVPNILFPSENVELCKWAVVACDQFTSQPDYWRAAEAEVGSAPSALRLMLPEMYLDKPGEAERIEAINAAMKQYTADGTLRPLGPGLMLVTRTVCGKTRTGLLAALDLENYDYSKGSSTLIRATEGTIVERIPPRLRIRRDAPLEMPHILVLIDDPDRTVIEPLAASAASEKPFYDFELMQGGGHLTGRFIADEKRINGALRTLEALADPARFAAKYGEGRAPLLFAMGDGNHSFATAKANWENIKAALPEGARAGHPARFCLVELENVHDEGIVFEPIHRVVFNVPDDFMDRLTKLLAGQNGGCTAAKTACSCEGAHHIPFVTAAGEGVLNVSAPAAQLPVGTLQNALDKLLPTIPGASIDYIHGDDVVKELGAKPGSAGFLLPPMDKSELFPTVVYDGALPRKTFSMGEACEKRYYLECRSLEK